MKSTESNVLHLPRRNGSPERRDEPPTFVVTGGPGTGLPEGQYLIRALSRPSGPVVVLAHRANPWESWGVPVEAVRS